MQQMNYLEPSHIVTMLSGIQPSTEKLQKAPSNPLFRHCQTVEEYRLAKYCHNYNDLYEEANIMLFDPEVPAHLQANGSNGNCSY